MLLQSLYDYLILFGVGLIGALSHYFKDKVKSVTKLNLWEWMFKKQPGASTLLILVIAGGVATLMMGPLGFQAIMASYFMGYSADSLLKNPLKIPGVNQ